MLRLRVEDDAIETPAHADHEAPARAPRAWGRELGELPKNLRPVLSLSKVPETRETHDPPDSLIAWLTCVIFAEARRAMAG